MTVPVPQPQLRLVGAEEASAMKRWRDARAAAAGVAQENCSASVQRGFDPTDPRWVLAVRAYAQLEGSILSPERRERVLRTARALGVRPFEANVIIAVVQDQARRGQPLGATQPMIQMIDRPSPPTRGVWVRWLGAAALAALANALLIWWLING